VANIGLKHNSLLHLLLKNGDFLNTDISQGSVATCLGYGGVFVHDLVTNFLLSLTVKEFWKSANIWWSYGQELGVLFFLTHGVDVCFIKLQNLPSIDDRGQTDRVTTLTRAGLGRRITPHASPR